MKQFYIAFFIILASIGYAQTIWTGPTITFTKADGADWTQAANQDRITSNVWLTRQNNQGIFNIVSESSYTSSFSPDVTEWAFGTSADISTLTFDNWEDTIGGNPPSMVNQDMVLHLIADDIYIDIKFLSWAEGRSGGQGGFSYERSTDQTASVDDTDQVALNVSPNPASAMIVINNLIGHTDFQIYDLRGAVVLKGSFLNSRSIDISPLQAGIYFLKVEDLRSVKFVKTS
jgi:hypothetical protein